MVDLTTLDAAKLWAGVGGPSDDVLIAQLITSYSQFVRSYTNLDFDVRSYTIMRNGRGQIHIMLPQRPINGVSSVVVDGLAILPQTSFGTYGFRFSDRAVILDGGAMFTLGQGNVVISYSAGYATIPADIAQAVNELVGLRYKEKDRIGFASKSLAGELVSFITKDMPVSVKTVLDQYSRKLPL